VRERTRAVASAISALGHPLVTVAIFLVAITVREGPRVLPVGYALAIVVGVTVPVALWNLRQTRAGRYTNFDVSMRSQRASMYAVIVGLMVTASVALHWAPVAREIRAGTLWMGAMFTAAWAMNIWIKVSLHAAVSFYLGLACTMIDVGVGMMLLGCAALVAASRLLIQRHTAAELCAGAGLGILAGIALRLS
jgi:hypothetical protein